MLHKIEDDLRWFEIGFFSLLLVAEAEEYLAKVAKFQALYKFLTNEPEQRFEETG